MMPLRRFAVATLCCALGMTVACSRLPAPTAATPPAYVSGLIAPTEQEYAALESTKMIRSFAAPETTPLSALPARVDLSHGLPQARDQGAQQSCTAWAAAFAVKSFQEHREHGWGLDEAHQFSPSFVYNQLNAGQNTGVRLLDVLQFVTDHGTVPYPLMPYAPDDFTTQPGPHLQALARNYRGLGYRRIAPTVAHLQSVLAAGEPVILVIEMFQEFLPAGMAATQNIYRSKSGPSLGHHAVVAVGYDHATRAIKTLNSWGTGWGERGFGWIDYDFAPHVLKQAFVLYDRPTPQTHAAATPDDARILLVPEEAGVTLGNAWLRLADPLTRAASFFPAGSAVHVEEDLFREQKIRMLRFSPASGVPIATNQGVTFGTTRAAVHRIYGAPDHIEPSNGEELYFFHAIAEHWGGITVTKHASLQFRYDGHGAVNAIALESVFKQAKTGQGFTSFQTGEQTAHVDGTRITVDGRGVAFTIPARFREQNKSVWDGTGVGYFCKDPDDMDALLVVKIFDTAEPVTAALLHTRMNADLQVYQLSAAAARPVSIAGLEWQLVDAGTRRYYYAGVGKQIVQMQLAAAQSLTTQPWVTAFLSSLTVAP